jgi:hypothetical protein
MTDQAKYNFSDLPITHEATARGILEGFRAGEVVILVGEKFSGMTMVAKRATGFLGTDVPFRAPHHTISQVGLKGSVKGEDQRPGELSRASGGVLYLDEGDEFTRHCLDQIACTVRDGEVTHPTGEGFVKMPGPGRVILSVYLGENFDRRLERATARFESRNVPFRVVHMPTYAGPEAYHRDMADKGKCPTTKALMAS